MQPEAGVVGPLLTIAFILGTAIFRLLSERSGLVPASTLTNSVAKDIQQSIDARDRRAFGRGHDGEIVEPRAFQREVAARAEQCLICLLYTSDAADE